MRFARIVFAVAGVWGIAVLTPLFFLVDVTGRAYAAPLNHQHFFYGFLAVAMAWQVAFLIIASDPARYRPLMLAAVLEKAGFIVTAIVLWSHGTISAEAASVAFPDAVLATLFVAAFVKTPSASR